MRLLLFSCGLNSYHFFHKTVTDIKPLLRARINDNFQVINPVPSG
jgi:hypothetical protein